MREPNSHGVNDMIISMDEVRSGRALARRVVDLPAIARRLVATRLARGLSASELGGRSGIAKNTISMWEHARNRPSLDQVALIVPVLNVSLDWIYFGDDTGMDWELRNRIAEVLPTVEIDGPVSGARSTGTDGAP